MADSILMNQATLDGTYNGEDASLTSNFSSVTLVNGLTVTKTADKTVWINGELIYTITITNNANYDFVNPVLTDTLDNTQVSLVEDSVDINSTTATYTYNSTTGLLSVNVPTITAGSTTAVTFKVTQI